MNIKIKTVDIILIIIFFTLSSTIFAVYSLNTDSGQTVVIRTPKGVFEYNLNTNRTLSFKGKISKVIIMIKNGKVGFFHSECKQKICLNFGFLNRAGTLIACVPNRISVYIESKNNKDSNGVDVICK
jgi:hypothetical protein